ncbi:hypothetical protein [Deinococcus altitudinis]|uniref:hypothetical protein n=1 Tax=Deinococcus altitudinis TaxID=468914 RepID=UPI003892A5BD
MTDPQNGMTLDQCAANVRQAIDDFELDAGLKLEVRTHATKSGTGGYLEIVGRSGSGEEEKAFAYRAAQSELEAQGDGWFTRKALRSLNDMFRAGHLPTAQEGVDHQTLKPGGEYTDEAYKG